MNYRRLFTVALCVFTLSSAVSVSPVAGAEPSAGSPIVYSDLYLKLIAAFPSGWVWDACGALLDVTSRSGVCTDTLQLAYFYPDGSFGPRPWYLDASSPTGWSIEPDPCFGLTENEAAAWATYVDFQNGYLDTGPDLTREQVDRYEACWGWWF